MNAVRVCLCSPIRVLTLVYIPRTTCTLVLAIYIASFPVSTPRLFFGTLHFPLCAKKSWRVEIGNEANLYTLHRPLLSPSFSSPPLLILLPIPPLLILLPVPAPPLLILLPVPTPPLLILLPYITSEGLEYWNILQSFHHCLHTYTCNLCLLVFQVVGGRKGHSRWSIAVSQSYCSTPGLVSVP